MKITDDLMKANIGIQPTSKIWLSGVAARLTIRNIQSKTTNYDAAAIDKVRKPLSDTLIAELKSKGISAVEELKVETQPIDVTHMVVASILY
ncbi:MAG TPA: hypothetical protein VJZ03_04845 [Candidatus Bathyarchaeia archaeon]|nr:hypothetical protein [Candidatus Bathyarchaeia archaeon]